MDDLKIYDKNKEQLQEMLEIVNSFTNGIKIEMDMDKCAVIHMNKEETTHAEHLVLIDQTTIPGLTPPATYKYPGFLEGLNIRDKNNEETTRKSILFS